MCIKIGHTVVQRHVVYEGTPFPSMTRNKEVLSTLFSGPEFTVRTDQDGDGNDVVVVEMPPKDEHGLIGSDTRCAILSDRILTVHLFPPQTIDDLAKVIHSTSDILKRVFEKLLAVYGIEDSPPDVYGKQWMAETKNVPCIKWLQARLSLEPKDICFEDSLYDEWSIVERDISAVRPTSLSFAIHTLPPGVKDSPASVQKRMECVQKFEVGIASPTEWDKGLGMIGARLRDLQPDVYINLLRVCT